MFNEDADGRIEGFDLCTDTLTQFCWGQVDVQTGRFGALVASKEGNVIQVHSRSLEDGTALVAQRMGCERRQPDVLPDAFDDFIKGAHGERTAWVTR